MADEDFTLATGEHIRRLAAIVATGESHPAALTTPLDDDHDVDVRVSREAAAGLWPLLVIINKARMGGMEADPPKFDVEDDFVTFSNAYGRQVLIVGRRKINPDNEVITLHLYHSADGWKSHEIKNGVAEEYEVWSAGEAEWIKGAEALWIDSVSG